LLKTEVVFR